jgi:hypothetical protein
MCGARLRAEERGERSVVGQKKTSAPSIDSSITANHFEVGLVEISVDQGRYMTGFDRVRDFDERSRWSDLTELPLCVGEVAPRDRAGIRAEVEPGLTIPPGIVNAQRLD